jgi:F0F1-type ATP synthase assembly protein I
MLNQTIVSLQDNKNNRPLMQYASLSVQLTAGLLIAAFLGKKLDAGLHFSTPVFIWVFPVIVIVASMLMLIKDTLNKK